MIILEIEIHFEMIISKIENHFEGVTLKETQFVDKQPNFFGGNAELENPIIYLFSSKNEEPNL